MRAIPPGQKDELVLLSDARRSLMAARTLPDLRRVMEAAQVAKDAAKRAVKLMEAQEVAIEVIHQANEAVQDAAAVRIEAQAGAGRILRRMRDVGELAGRGNRTGSNQFEAKDAVDGEVPLTLVDIGVDDHDSALWQRVGAVSEEVRDAYVAESRTLGREITTTGLLRFVEGYPARGEPEPIDITDELDRAYYAVMDAMRVLERHGGADAIAAHAVATRRKKRFRDLVERTLNWASEAESVLK